MVSLLQALKLRKPTLEAPEILLQNPNKCLQIIATDITGM
jgi:hypothetical protein